MHRETLPAFLAQSPVKEKPISDTQKIKFRLTHAVESTESFSSVDLHQTVNHSPVALVVRHVDVVVILQTETGLHDPDGIRQEEREDTGFAGRQHVQRWAEGLCGVATLDPSLDCVVAVGDRKLKLF